MKEKTIDQIDEWLAKSSMTRNDLVELARIIIDSTESPWNDPTVQPDLVDRLTEWNVYTSQFPADIDD